MEKSENEKIGRSLIVQEARAWIGTPFRRKGRVKYHGCDCVGLALCVMRDLGIVDWTKEDWANIYPDQPLNDLVLEICRERLKEKPADEMLPGDLLVFRVPNHPCHVGIVSDAGMIHAYAGYPRRVVEHAIDETWRARIEGCFELPGVSD